MKKQESIPYLHCLISSFLGLGSWLFFGHFYRHHLLYQEQYQLFLFTPDYLMETIGRPGGAAEYAARFLTQFYYYPWLGGLIIASLLTLMQRQVLCAVRLIGGRKGLWEVLTWAPSLGYWALLCDENYMLTGVVALMGVLAAFPFGRSIRSASLRTAYGLAMIPALYVLAGGVAVVFGLLCIASEMGKGGLGARRSLLFAAGCGLLCVLTPLLARYVCVQYPLSKLWTGADYYRFPTIFPFPLLLLWLSVPALAVVFKRLPPVVEAGATKRNILANLSMSLLWGAFSIALSHSADWEKEEVMRYDDRVRRGQWERIVRAANRKTPRSPLSVAFLNLALCKQGQMPDRMFRYYQNGPEGLLPSFVRDFSLPMMAGEIYYHLGFINTAQRFAFEAMEAIPDFQRSVRGVKRLAETNLLNGDYEVSRKYLRLLRHTLFYRRWAGRTLACLYDEERIDANPEWARLRKYRTKTDFFFSEEEKDMMLGILLQQDFSNRPAYEYLMAYCLLTKDLKHFYQYFPLGESLRHGSIPKSYQEALIYIWGLSNRTMERLPYPVSDEVKRQVEAYRSIYVSQAHPEPALRSKFSDTYWYYFHFRK
jgi:hypothetical protein